MLRNDYQIKVVQSCPSFAANDARAQLLRCSVDDPAWHAHQQNLRAAFRDDLLAAQHYQRVTLFPRCARVPQY
jgi:hypothetical protein